MGGEEKGALYGLRRQEGEGFASLDRNEELFTPYEPHYSHQHTT